MAAVKKPRASANNDYYVKDIGLADRGVQHGERAKRQGLRS